jgi:transposase
MWPGRRIMEDILCVDRIGCAWRYLPADFPPWRTVYGYFAAWRDDGTLARLRDALRAGPDRTRRSPARPSRSLTRSPSAPLTP